MKKFGVMLDCSRNAVMKVEEVKKFAAILKKFGYNMMMLYTEDTYEVDGEPYFGYLRGRYSKAELKEIVRDCEKMGVEVIPCIQTLAHLERIFRWADYPSVNDQKDTLLVGAERTYELIENMFRSLRDCFDSEYVHIGMDEAHALGRGQYLDLHGARNRFEILSEHLARVIEIAKKYGFKPVMWSDMFFRLGNHGEYYPENPVVSEECVALTPKEVDLVYWDYYHTDKATYDKMFAAHKKFENGIWFAGGAWTWNGFASGNKTTLDTMFPAMESVKENGIENVVITLWGDNGKECSFYSVLPSLFAIRRYCDGERDDAHIRAEFSKLTGEDYDAFFALDLANFVGNNATAMNNPCKYMLYSDPFYGFFDSTISDGAEAEYEAHAARLEELSKAGNYSYLFACEAALCRLLAVKYPLGKRTREAYKKGKEALAALVKGYEEAEKRLETFYRAFRTLWYKENKPQGFDVHDLRLGGLARRLRSCRERIESYLGGEIDGIPELEEEILPFHAFEQRVKAGGTANWNSWATTASVHEI